MSLSCHEGPAGMGPGCPLASGRPGTGVSFPCPFLWWPRSWDPLSTSHLCPRPVLGLCFSGGPGLTVSADPGAPGEGPQGTRGFLPVPAKPCGRECLVLGVCRADRGLQPTAVSSRGAETPHTGPVGQRRTAGRAKPRGTVPVRLHAVTGRTQPGATRPGSLASGAPWWRLPLAPQPSRAATSRPGARTRVPREVLSLLCLPGDVVGVRVSGARVYATSASGIKCPVYASLVPPANKRRVSCGRWRTPHFI